MGLANTTPNAAKALTESNKSREVIAEMTVPLIGKPIGKGSTANPASKLDPESDHPVIKRAIKIGILPERIALFTDITELERQCQLIKPQSTAKAGKKKKKKQVIRGGYIIKGEPTIIKCTIEMTEARAQHVARCTYDEGQLGDFLRHERIDPRCVNNLTFNRCCVPKRGMLVTVVTIDYMKE
jgi:hypothetical protein